MSETWYYVEKGQRIGPIDQTAMVEKIKSHAISENDFVWKKGLANWKKLKEMPELLAIYQELKKETEIPPFVFDIAAIDRDEKIFTIMTGADREGERKEYGPFSLNMLIALYKSNRVSGKTLVYAPGMNEWTFLAELPTYSEIFSDNPPPIQEEDKRHYKRKPFVARMFFHDSKKIYEGVCRDISVGGMQIMIADFPGKAGDKISINVHPENSNVHFVASGKIVRMLDGAGGFSFRFTDLNQEALNLINKYVSQESM